MSKLDENDQVMPNLMFLCQSGIWPILCQLMAILANLLDIDFKLVFSSIYINFDTQTNFEVNQTQISHSIPKNIPKNQQSGHYLKTPFCPSVIHQKAYSSYMFRWICLKRSESM